MVIIVGFHTILLVIRIKEITILINPGWYKLCVNGVYVRGYRPLLVVGLHCRLIACQYSIMLGVFDLKQNCKLSVCLYPCLYIFQKLILLQLVVLMSHPRKFQYWIFFIILKNIIKKVVMVHDWIHVWFKMHLLFKEISNNFTVCCKLTYW